MSKEIKWKCLGDEYLLIKKDEKKIIPTELWWSSVAGGKPTDSELKSIWQRAWQYPGSTSLENNLTSCIEELSELKEYIALCDKDLSNMRIAYNKEEITKEELQYHETLSFIAHQQLNTVKQEISKSIN